MCGIAAALADFDPDASLTLTRRMLNDLSHRGNRVPRFSATAVGALGCARLGIVGQSAADEQPLWSEDRTLVCVFNGEIYNWRELAADLQNRGYQFRAETDTEVLVHGYREWGAGLPDRLDGMYAFVLLDTTTGHFFAARDPFGMKPLYYTMTDGRTLFASELRALLRAGGDPAVIRRVPAGGTVTESAQSARVRLPHATTPFRGSLAESAQETRRRLAAAVARLVPPDQPIAVLCGGGIDSSAVLYEAAQCGRPVVAYAIGVNEAASDLRAAGAVCRALAARGMEIDYRPIFVSPTELLRSVPTVIRTIESFEPNHVRGGTLSYALGRAVREDGLSVVLCGEGADELFAGYPEFQRCLTAADPPTELRRLEARFVSELHKTQLRRVDRTNMAFAVEVRVPFLDTKLAQFALNLPLEHKLELAPDRRCRRVKVALREAYRGLLPNDIVDRPKVVLSDGAGMGDNSQGGPFAESADCQMSDAEFRALAVEYPEYRLRHREEAVYFDTFLHEFGRLALAADRPLVNNSPTKG